jgi:hypothetical protein
MGQYATATVAYGFAAPEGLDEQDMEEVLSKKKWPDVGYVMAGPYDKRDQAYVVTFAESASPGEPSVFKLPARRTENAWCGALLDVAKENDWPRPDPQWLILADVS